jgi:glycolate oxidase iron-sulfur subunit
MIGRLPQQTGSSRLRDFPNPIADAHLCCGSAGTYILDQPEIAASLGAQKARAVIASGADVAASGNIGCLTQLRIHLVRAGSLLPVRHTMQLLWDK